MFSYIILYISYILFGIAILIFINSCFNLNKVSTGREGTLIDKPIFEYLKEDDIMYIDEYLLNTKSPIFITVVSIFSISLFSIICIRLWWNNYKKDIQFPYEIDNKTFIIASLSYLFTFIIIITYNEFRRIYVNETFLGCDKEYKNDITDDILALEKEDSSSYLKELKKIIINMLENDKTYKNDADIKSKLEKSNDIDVSSIAKGLKLEEGENQISILKLILEIYEKDYKDKEKIKYIKYINDYFDLLIDNKRSNYTKYYILGLAKNIPDKINNVCNIFKNSLDDIKNKIYAYFVVIILFFCLCYIVVPLIIFWNLDRNYFNKFIIDISYNIFSITILFTLFFTFIIYFALFYTKGIR